MPDDVKGFLDGIFAYKLGDILIHRAARLDPSGIRFVHRLQVIERHLAQYSGGVQCHYAVRDVDEWGHINGAATLHEEEVMPIPPQESKEG